MAGILAALPAMGTVKAEKATYEDREVKSDKVKDSVGELPGKVVVRRGKWLQQGRSISLASQASTIDTMRTSSNDTMPRTSSKLSSQTACTQDSEASRPSSRNSNSKTLQSGGRQIMNFRASTVEERPSLEMGSYVPERRQQSKESTRSVSTLEDEPPAQQVVSTAPGGKRESRLSLFAAGKICQLASQKRKTTLDMSPRTVRKHNLHKHRMSFVDPDVDQEHHHHSQHGTFLNAESLQILASKEVKRPQEDDGLYGFKVDDRVTTQDGPDADGPWKKALKEAGPGYVAGPCQRKGCISVWFETSDEWHQGDTFQIKACNLLNITEPSRSGKNMRPVEVVVRVNGEKKRTRTIACRAQAVKQQIQQEASVEAEEPSAFTFRDGLDAVGLEIGDKVGDSVSFEHLGTVVKEGREPHTVLVRVGQLGIRCFRAADLTKVEMEMTAAEKRRAALKARHIDVKHRSAFTLTLEEADGKFDLEEQEKDVVNEVKTITFAEDGETAFVSGDFIRVKDTSDNAGWRALGIGCVRGPGRDEGTVEVQFDSGAEAWVLSCTQLERVDRSEATDRVFRKTNQDMLRKRGSISGYL